MEDRRLRSVKDRAEAQELLELWEASGEPMKTWCRGRGLNWFSLNAHLGWIRRRVPGGPRQLPALVEVAVPGRPRSAAVYRVDVDGLVLEVGEHFDDDAVRRLVRVLVSC